MTPRRGFGWRDEAAASLLARHIPVTEAAGPALVAGDPRDEVVRALTDRGIHATRWNRRAGAEGEVGPWPTGGPYDTVALRLPLARDELEMTLHAVLAVQRPGGRLLVYGANDEGIGSTAARIEPLAGPVEIVASGGRCRVLAALRPPLVPGLRASLPEWRDSFALPFPELPHPWISYPGVFAHGRVDEGSLLLAGTLPALGPRARVLDFGCGSGLLGALVLARRPDAAVRFLDVDSVALQAVQENVAGADVVLGDRLRTNEGRYDLVVSNPPIHVGKETSLTVLEGLVSDAPKILAANGQLLIVTQRRLPVSRILESVFRRSEVAADDGALHRVWRAWSPRRVG